MAIVSVSCFVYKNIAETGFGQAKFVGTVSCGGPSIGTQPAGSPILFEQFVVGADSFFNDRITSDKLSFVKAYDGIEAAVSMFDRIDHFVRDIIRCSFSCLFANHITEVVWETKDFVRIIPVLMLLTVTTEAESRYAEANKLLTTREQAIVAVASYTRNGNLERLKPSVE